MLRQSSTESAERPAIIVATAIDVALNEEIPAADIELVTPAERQAVIDALGLEADTLDEPLRRLWYEMGNEPA